ncbi:Mucolipin-2 [Tupaia chinensis]|uniref:Mucolipin-2 n=1 Tax=Tupaia chinensis TaxID=246437 RepID=L9KRP3_TUPCH|nr:Mucolipin-2 [Tupaia chinensis]
MSAQTSLAEKGLNPGLMCQESYACSRTTRLSSGVVSAARRSSTDNSLRNHEWIRLRPGRVPYCDPCKGPSGHSPGGNKRRHPMTMFHVNKVQESLEAEEIEEEIKKKKMTEKAVSFLLVDENEDIQITSEVDFIRKLDCIPDQHLKLVRFGLSNQLVVSFKEDNTIAFKHLFLKGYSGTDEDDYSCSVYTQEDTYESIFFAINQYHRLKDISLGTLGYGENEDNRIGIKVCKQHYKKGTMFPSNETLNIDSDTELGSYKLKSPSTSKIIFDNKAHSGKIKIYFDSDANIKECKDLNIFGSTQKQTQYVLAFDAFVIVICLASLVLCSRSVVLALRLRKRFLNFFLEKYQRRVCDADRWEFINGWYVLVILSDLMTIIGSILKMEIKAKNLTNYDLCSIFLGTSTLLVWVGVIRYLGYFQAYNVLILTMQASLPKVLRFCACAGMIYLGYTFCGWIVLGPYHDKYFSESEVTKLDDSYALLYELIQTQNF